MRSVQPPKKPAATPASPPIRNTSATDATAMKKSSRVATMTRLKHVAPELVGAEPVRGRGRLQRLRGVAGERIVGDDIRPDQGRQHDQHEQAEGKAGDAVLAQHVAHMTERRRKAGRVGVLLAGGDVGHASILTRGSIRP